MTAAGILVGEIAHIEAALPDGPRFRDSMTNEERRSAANLILLCATHHTEIDGDTTTWTVDGLSGLKKQHEAIYSGAVDRLRSTVGDVTADTPWQPALNLGAFYWAHELSSDELEETRVTLNDLAERLASIPVGARSALAVIVHRGDTVPPHLGPGELSIPLPLLTQLVSCSKEELRDHLAVLEHQSLLWVDPDPFEGPPLVYVGASTRGIGWPVFSDLHTLAGGDRTTVQRALVDLDFTAFDR